jgi:hypothetical protein
MEETMKIQYQVGEAWKGEYNADTPYSYAAVVQDPTGLSVYRSLKSGNVGHPLTDETWWFKIIDLSSIKSESDRIDALNDAVDEAERLRVAAEEARERQSAADHQQYNNDHTQYGNDHQQAVDDHTQASNDHTRANTDHQQAVDDHTQYTTDHGKELEREQAEQGRVQAETLREQSEAQRSIAENNRAASETQRHQQYSADHTQAGNDHRASTEATTKASNVNATVNGTVVTVTDKNGVQTSVDIGFYIYKTYASVAAMNADAENVADGKFVMIATTDTTSTDNAKLYVRNENAASSAEPFTFLCDLDQAATTAWADWFNNYKPTIESDHARAESDHTQALTDHGTASSDHTRAENDHVQAGSDHQTASADHTTADADHTTAQNDHTQYGTDHQNAAADHAQAGADHTQAGNDHTRANEDHQSSSEATAAANDAAEAASALQVNLENGTVIPKLADNLTSWEERSVQAVAENHASLVDTTGGTLSIDASKDAILPYIACTGADFSADALIMSGFNLLRLQSNNGSAVAVGAGYYFPVPALVWGAYGAALENNGVLFINSEGECITPTVYWKSYSDGAPTSITDGVQLTPYESNGYSFYIGTTEPGYLIVSGIDWANTCAHLGWSTDYDKYVSPTDEEDDGTNINLSLLGTLRAVWKKNDIVFDYWTYLPTGDVKVTNVGFATDLTWTNTAEKINNVSTGNYKHEATINDISYNGIAQILLNGGTARISLTVEGNNVSFMDQQSTVASGYGVWYQLAAPTYTPIGLITNITGLSDWGINVITNAHGNVMYVIRYALNVPDAVYGLIAQTEENTENIKHLQTTPAPLADNITSWANREGLPVDDTWTDIVRTTAGDVSVNTENGGKIVSIYPNGGDFTAAALKTTGFNLLHNAVQIGSTTKYYFLVPKLTFGNYGTAKENNGVLFTKSDNTKLTPTVYFKALADGVPTANSYGSAADYVGSNGYRFYTTPGVGYMVIDLGSLTIGEVCAHIAWSKRYDEFVAYNSAADAGSTINLSSLMPLRYIDTSVYDSIVVSGTTATKAQRVGQISIAATDWTTTSETTEGGTTYTHAKTITGMKSGGLVRALSGVALMVDGTTVSYQDSNEDGAAMTVNYELASGTSSSVMNIYGAGNSVYVLEDWGLEMWTEATGSAIVTTEYTRNYADTLAAIAQYELQVQMTVISQLFLELKRDFDGLRRQVADNMGILNAAEYKKNGEKVFDVIDGAPTDYPKAVGLARLDTTNGNLYISKDTTGSVSDWVLV